MPFTTMGDLIESMLMINKAIKNPHDAGVALQRIAESLNHPTESAIAALKRLKLERDDVRVPQNKLVDVFGKLAAAGMTADDARDIVGSEFAPVLVELAEDYRA